ncbi:hypothetical protein A1Q1_01180 [Trichosporon asahii var. asahii CBS 2479]|uniref:Uncharacterized protein n=1 Tax=Trichosporon asahii var. asahii (strain ATCC 90039 / CBS 2479 / JCM 2466 / KCTC 7840 / NBRC 103889/ NCYC 2677 / UAMH 7654) TaxID=1186058 RepID=J6F394_TRIAS|nr:hypothetical protein A1Q1_01180 [Trichosporon asahii var. asahii CBS 2479]EJT49682.1 hypothetical protein A1Q1_01180 [Trichosporon asahii var. asahii CBS 2479]
MLKTTILSLSFAAVFQRDDAPSSSVPAPSASASVRPPGFVEFGNTSSVPDKCKDSCAPWLQTLDNNGSCLSYLDVASNGDGKGFDDDYLGLNCKNKDNGQIASLQLLCNHLDQFSTCGHCLVQDAQRGELEDGIKVVTSTCKKRGQTMPAKIEGVSSSANALSASAAIALGALAAAALC